MRKKLLYSSCHITAESDDLEIYSNLGFECVTTGKFISSVIPGSDPNISSSLDWTKHDWRAPKFNTNIDLTKEFLSYNPKFNGIASIDANLPKSFLEKFDVIVISGFIHRLPDVVNKVGNNPNIKIIYNAVGQTTPYIEAVLQKCKNYILLNRYSKAESGIYNVCGMYSEADSFIHGSVNPDFDVNWTGDNKELFTIARAIKTREKHTNYNLITTVMEGLPSKIYGQGNENVPAKLNGGSLGYSELIKTYQHSRVIILGGISPAAINYTFLEAMYVGTPVLALGRKLGRSGLSPSNFYDLPTYIENGVDGFYSDNVFELQDIAKELLRNDQLAKRVSEAASRKGRQNYSTAAIQGQWKTLFEEHGIL